MTREKFLGWMLILALGISSCSFETQQSTEPPPTAPGPAATDPTEQAAVNAADMPRETSIPVTWSELQLTGRLIYMRGVSAYDRYYIDIEELDLVTGVIRVVFVPPEKAWIFYATVSPDGQQLTLSYSPPPPRDLASPRAAIYVMPLDGSSPPELLFDPPTPDDQELQVEWSPDGRYVYYTQVNYQVEPAPGQLFPVFKIFRRALPDGPAELVADKAYWPSLSADSSRLVYVLIDPFSSNDQIYLSEPGGGNAEPLALSGPSISDTTDAPIFAPDGTSIIFSGPAPFPSYRPNWLETLFGIRIARAHGTSPSDWWSVPKTGGEPTRLTHLQTLALYASIAPDNQHIASFSSSGIFVMKPDGSSVTMILPDVGGIAGTVTWLP